MGDLQKLALRKTGGGVNKRQRKKKMKKLLESDAFSDFLKASTFNLETPVLNTLMGEEPYKFKDIWGPVHEKWKSKAGA